MEKQHRRKRKKKAAPKPRPVRPRTITLHLYHVIISELLIEAKYHGITLEEYCEWVLRRHLRIITMSNPGRYDGHLTPWPISP